MAFVPALAAGVGTLGSFIQSKNQKGAQQQNQSNEQSIIQQMERLFNGETAQANSLLGGVQPIGAINQAKNFYSSEVTGGLDPAVIGAAQGQYQAENARNLSTLEDTLGPYTPNVAGMIGNFSDQAITGNVALQQQLAALNQQTRQQGAGGLSSLGLGTEQMGLGAYESAAGGLSGLAGLYGLASNTNAQNAWANNPFLYAANALGGLNPGSTTNTNPGTMGLNFSGIDLPGLAGGQYGPQFGQGGLGVTGGGGLGSGGGGTGSGY